MNVREGKGEDEKKKEEGRKSEKKFLKDSKQIRMLLYY